MPISAGSRLGPYEILSPLGTGGMGEVYKARDTRLGRDVAIKVLPEKVAQDPDALARFEREAKAVAALSHPNILALHDFGREGTVAYAVMELLEGETLGGALASGALPPRRATDYAVQIAQGLAAAHEKGIVHRDLKPDNVFVTRDERVKILDFGLAKSGAAVADARNETQSPTVSGYTEPGTILGTVGYMSPEQVRGLAADHRSDIFSFGSVLYEMLTGRRPFARETPVQTMNAILTEDPFEQAAAGPGVPPSMAPVLRHCLEKKPERRFQSARDLAFALEVAGAKSGATPAPALEAPAPSLALKWAAGVLALLAAAAVGYLLAPRRVATSGPDWKDATLSRLTTDPGYEGEPTFSPDGQTIAYVADRDGNFEIYLQQISGGPAINLTRNPAADMQPAFSPDGREIAFVSDREGGTEIYHSAPALPRVGGDIWVMPTLGGPARRVARGGNFPSWTPDGSALLYTHGAYRSSRVALVSSSGGASRDLPIEDAVVARYFFPSISPDGRWLLYQNGHQIEVVAAQGGKAKNLVQGECPAWGPGSSVVFTSNLPGKGRTLWTAPFSPARGELDGSPRPLTFGRGSDLGAAVSRDGAAIAFSAADETLNLASVPFDAEAGRVLGAERDLTAGDNRVGFFDPSPDGKSIVFDQDRGAGSHLWRLDPPSPPIELTRDPAYEELYPAWSPDGREVLFSRWPVGKREGPSLALWLMNGDGTSPRRVTEMTGPASWTPDGKRILIPRGEDVLLFDPASGQTTPVPGANGRTLVFVDPSGQWVVSQVTEGSSFALSAVPITGGAPRIVVPASYEAFHPFFSRSGRWLYVQRNHKNIFRVPGPAQGWKPGTPEQVTNFSGNDLYIEQPTLSPDGSKLLYTRGRQAGNILIYRLGKPSGAK